MANLDLNIKSPIGNKFIISKSKKKPRKQQFKLQVHRSETTQEPRFKALNLKDLLIEHVRSIIGILGQNSEQPNPLLEEYIQQFASSVLSHPTNQPEISKYKLEKSISSTLKEFDEPCTSTTSKRVDAYNFFDEKLWDTVSGNYGNWDLHLSETKEESSESAFLEWKNNCFTEMSIDLPQSVQESLSFFNDSSKKKSASEQKNIQEFNASLKDFCGGVFITANNELFREHESSNPKLLSIAELAENFMPTVWEAFNCKLKGPPYPQPTRNQKRKAECLENNVTNPQPPKKKQTYSWIKIIGDGSTGKPEKIHLSASDAYSFEEDGTFSQKVTDAIIRDLCYQSRLKENCATRKCFCIPASGVQQLMTNFQDTEFISEYLSTLIANIDFDLIDSIILPLFIPDKINVKLEGLVLGIIDLRLNSFSFFDVEFKQEKDMTPILSSYLEKCWNIAHVLTEGKLQPTKTNFSNEHFKGLSVDTINKIDTLTKNEKHLVTCAFLEQFCGFPLTNDPDLLCIFRNSVRNVTFPIDVDFMEYGSKEKLVSVKALRERYFYCIKSHKCPSNTLQTVRKPANFWTQLMVVDKGPSNKPANFWTQLMVVDKRLEQ